MTEPHHPLRLTIDREALVSNWRWLASMSGTAACGAAVKANGYGLGARETMATLAAAGCREFFVATWAEAERLLPLPEGLELSVLHGLAAEDVTQAIASRARPVLNTPLQVARWREQAADRPCNVMVDTGMNRLGLSPEEAASGMLEGLDVDTLMSHLACGDEDVEANGKQLAAFRGAGAAVPARRLSLANSAGICLGSDYCFDLTRPGLAIYGGIARPEAENHVRQVLRAEVQIVQRRQVRAGDSIGYNAAYTAGERMELAILNLGYADGYARAFSNRGRVRLGDTFLPVVGRISMDLTAIAVDAAPDLREGDWVELDLDLQQASAQSGLSQYELLTMLGTRYKRIWS